MINIKPNQNKYSAFTLIEMVIVLVIMGILLLVTLNLSGEQIQKVKDKTVKESIIAEMQSRYSRNLWSSSFGWEMYDTMDININKWGNKIDFAYKKQWETKKENTFTNQFEIKYIIPDYKYEDANPKDLSNITLHFTPYKISCKIWEWETLYNNIVIIARVNDNKDYCFEIDKQNCRMIDVSESKCDDLENKTNLKEK